MKLSERELTVLKLMRKGFKNKIIAEELGLDEKTISSFVLRIRNKLEIDSKYNSFYLVSKAIKLGVLK